MEMDSETEQRLVVRAIAAVEAMLDNESVGNSMRVAGDEFSPTQLASIVYWLATSRPELQFDFSHANQDPHVFVVVIRTNPPKFLTFPFRNAAQRKTPVEDLLPIPNENKGVIPE